MMTSQNNLSSAIQIVNHSWATNLTGVMADQDIKRAMCNNDILIYPFNPSQLTGVGYNLSSSDLIISTHTGMPLKIFKGENQRYVWVKPHDTILISTKEYVRVSRRVMGTFHSRVLIVSQGFGHISTTLDPNWSGPLLIALNNPSSRKLKFILEDHGIPQTFATLVFYYLQNASERDHDNRPNRVDILMQYRTQPSWIRQLVFHKQLQKYDDFIDRINQISRDLNGSHQNCDILDQATELIEHMQALTCTEGELLLKNKASLLSLVDKCQTFLINFEQPAENFVLCEMVRALEALLKHNYDSCIPAPFSDSSSLVLSIRKYLKMFKKKIQNERIARKWIEAYEDITSSSQTTMQGFWIRMAFGDYGRFLKNALVILLMLATLAGLFIAQITGRIDFISAIVAGIPAVTTQILLLMIK